MAALTADRRFYAERPGRTFFYEVDAAQRIFAGALIAQLSSGAGYVRPAAANAALVVVGVAQESVNNLDGLAGTVHVKAQKGVFLLENNGDIARQHIGRAAYVVDDQTVSSSHANNTRPQAGTIVLVDDQRVWVDVGVLSAHDEARPVVGVRTLAIGHADLTAEALNQAIPFAEALPAGARVIGREIRVTEAFSGGGAAAVSVDVGTAADADAIVDGANVFTGGPGAQAGTSGVNPTGTYDGATLQATVISDVNVDLLTAGALVIDVLFVVLP